MKIATYIRLSNADEDIGFGKIESESISNQRKYIIDYINKNSVLSKYEKIEFVDDGFSAINDERPSLKKMMECVRNGEISVICVKDLSRFFRDYIEAGNYLECVFPFLGVRFISINDNYDSDNYKGTTGGIEMVMRNIVYASYSKDLSLKISSAKRQKTISGKFIGSHPPFGYKKADDNINKLVIDEVSSKYVRKIFDLVLEGNSTTQVAKILNDENMPTKGQYYKMRYIGNKKHSSMLDTATWNARRVNEIIRARVYAGDLVGQVKKKVNFNSKKTIRQKPIIVENTHKGIVTREEFLIANEMIKNNKKGSNRVYKKYPLKTLVKCGVCKYCLERKKISGKYIYNCKNAITGSNKDCKKYSGIEESRLETLTFNAVKSFIELVNEKDLLLKNKKTQNIPTYIDNLLSGYKQTKLRIYEKYVSAEISKEEYLSLKKDIEHKIKKLEIQKQSLEKKQTVKDEKHIITLCKKYLKEDNLTSKIANTFIDEIFVYDNENIEIKLKFNDLFNKSHKPY